MMTNRAVMILTLLIGLLLAELGVRCVEPSLPDLEEWPTAETELKSGQIRVLDEKIDLVIIGSSVSEAAIDPSRLAGISVYNAALPFSSPKSNALWLENEVLRRLSPSVVLLGLSEATLASGEDLLYAPFARIASNGSERPWWQSSALLRRRSQIRDWGQTIQRMQTLDSDLWTERGHQTGYYDDAIEAIAGGQRGGRSQPHPEQMEAVDAMIRSIRRAGARPIVLIEPGDCPPTYEACPDRSQIREAMLAVLAAADLDVIIDGNSVTWPVSMFADGAHFNREGTLAFTEFLSQQLEQLGVLPHETEVESEVQVSR